MNQNTSGSATTDAENVVDLSSLQDPVAETEALAVALAPLGKIGVPVANFTRPQIHAIFLSVPSYIKEIKGLTSISSEEMLAEVFNTAVMNGICKIPSVCDVTSILNVARWIKKGKGAKCVADVQHALKLKSKATHGATPQQVALAQILDQQMQDMAGEVKRVRNDSELKISRWQKKINNERRKMDKALKGIESRYVPANSFKPLEREEVSRRCWEKYEADCRKKGTQPAPWSSIIMARVEADWGNQVQAEHRQEFVTNAQVADQLNEWGKHKIAQLKLDQDFVAAKTLSDSWLQQVEVRLWSHPLEERKRLGALVPVGRVKKFTEQASNSKLMTLLSPELLQDKRQVGARMPPDLRKGSETGAARESILDSNPRVSVLRELRSMKHGGIPTARSKFEAGVRKVIGGGEMSNWREVSNLYRGGGCFSDAILLLSDAVTTPPENLLGNFFSISKAREILQLPSGLPVPQGPDCVRTKNFNHDATSGPFLRAFGIKNKYGMKNMLETFAWNCYERFANEGGDEKLLPHITSRVGYRTKLLPKHEAFEKMAKGKPVGRCVMMLDAIEQVFSSPLYNVLSVLSAEQRFERNGGFRNAIVRASTDWLKMWDEVRISKVIVELDWKKFDRERPSEDLCFMVSLICSCFEPKNLWEEKLLEGYRIMLRRALVERCFVTDDGGVFRIDGMVPSGSLWTGWVDTALNILYLRAVLTELGIPSTTSLPKCAGDDNLTLFYEDYPDSTLFRVRDLLNSWFRAGIEGEDFIIHRPPFHVTKEQACFPPGTDLANGTSRILDQATWVSFTDNVVIDQPAGKSHRWRYRFEGRPKFLSCYWLENGRPIRPASLNTEKLLYPEGIHKNLAQYQAAVISMVVDNPWNQHNVNHCMHRFVICEQVRRQSALGVKPIDIIWYSRFRAKKGETVPYPMIASWRRREGWVDMEQLQFVREYIKDFREFVSGVTSLYARNSSGGIDAWKFTEFIRGEGDLGEGQFGNELNDWFAWLSENPLSKYLRPIKRFRKEGAPVEPSHEVKVTATQALQHLWDILGSEVCCSSDKFSLHVSNLLMRRSEDLGLQRNP
ncbi:TPA_asm: fusion protein [Acer pseudosieboldianum amalgavirus 1]|nr:TPA_asm: fusion protein [Acer pseudosieboldianum amalgavirus 1]